LTINFDAISKIQKDIETVSPSTELLIVTKNQNIEDIDNLISRGYSNFGENRVQEAYLKYSQRIINQNINLNLIGPLQTNKVKIALNLFNTIQTLDREKLVDEIVREQEKNKTITKNFFIQINIGQEKQKNGIQEIQLNSFYEYCLNSNLNIIGLMCIPPNNENTETYFSKMILLRNQINPALKLSMGMSNDYLIALKYKTDLIRIGSKIFRDE
jgi:pyridoxal phosphate enzyme (YggS family)